MNKELELEAEKYISDMDAEFYKDGISTHEIQQLAKKDFIEGATSKYVEKQKLEFAIEYLYLVRNSCFDIENRIQELEQQLKQLEL